MNHFEASTRYCEDLQRRDLNHSAKAIQDMAQRKLTSEFKQLSEIIFAVAGLVGGLGDKYARNAAAHAMHDAISKYIPESHRFLHGEK